MIYLVTYSNDLYMQTRDFCVKMALKKGKVDKTIVYSPENIDPDFYLEHKDVLDIKKGNGMWLWKPYFINKALKEIDKGDILIYLDAASFFYKNCSEIVKCLQKQDIWVSNIGLVEKQYTKHSLFVKMDCLEDSYMQTNQIQGSFFALKKTDFSEKFVEEWLDCCSKKELLLDDIDAEEIDGFIEHRYDQSILSLLAKKYKINVHQDPSQYGRVPELYSHEKALYLEPDNCGEYRPFIILHREKDINNITIMKMWIYTWMPLGLLSMFSKRYRNAKKRTRGIV